MPWERKLLAPASHDCRYPGVWRSCRADVGSTWRCSRCAQLWVLRGKGRRVSGRFVEWEKTSARRTGREL